MPVPGLTRAAIRAQHDTPSFERGERYQREGRVGQLEEVQTPYGTAVSGEVVGRDPYEVYVSLERDRTGLRIDSDCTCPVGVECKHAVALLLEYLEQGGRADTPAVREKAATETWVRRLAQAAAPTAPDSWPARVHHRLLFVLDVAAAGDEHGLWVALASARRLKSGGYGQPSPVSLRRVLGDYRPAYILQRDVQLVQRLVELGMVADDHVVVVRAGAEALLDPLLATGRCHWQTPAAPALRRGESRTARPDWRLADDGMQELDWRLDPPADTLLPLTPPWYLDLQRSECGSVETGLPPELAAALVDAPRVAPDEVVMVASRLAETLPDLPRPTEITTRDLPAVRPTPCVDLYVADGDMETPAELAGEIGQDIRARLRFRYHDHEIEAGDDRTTLVYAQDGRVERLPRDREAEAAALCRLRDAGFASLPQAPWERGPQVDFVPADKDEAAGWLRFLASTRPELEAAGWAITIVPGFPYDVAHPESWYGEIKGEAASDWFSVDLGVIVDGERLPLLPLLQQWLRAAGGARARLRELEAGTPAGVSLPDGRHLILPPERVEHILATLVELFDPDIALDDKALTLPRWRAMSLEAPDGVAWQGADGLRAAAEHLRAAGGLEAAPVPAGLKAQLRGYQQTGLDWLQFLRTHGLAGVLADDMGLGKTVQTLAHLLLEKEAGRADRPALVVAPTSLLANWRREAATFAPDLRVAIWHGPERHALLDGLGDCDLVLTTYTLLARDREALTAQPFHLAVLDEAHYIKNPRTHAAQAARTLDARHRLCLTGTPLENHLGEAWSLFDFLLPGLLGSERQFKRLFRTPIEKDGNGDRRQHLQRRLAPFLLRRRKDEVVAELPPKTEIQRTVALEGGQRDLYESIRLAMHREVRDAIAAQGLDRSRIVVLDALLKLRQACCDPRLVKLDRARRVPESAKLRLLTALLPEMIEEGRRVLLFSQFTSMLTIIEQAVKEAGIPCVKLTGRTRDRAKPVDRFQQGQVPLFLISLKAGGTGLNLTAADTVIHYDPWWNPAVETQATDRAHRIGQDKPVFVYKLVTQGTVEERIVGLQDNKRALAEGLFAEGAGSAVLSPEDVDALFAPLE